MQPWFQKLKSVFPSENHKRFLWNSIAVSFSKAFSSICNLAFMVLAVNILSKVENGFFQYYFSIIPVLLAIAEFGIPQALIRFLAPKTESISESSKILQASIWAKGTGLFLLLLIGVIYFFFQNESIYFIFLLVLGAFISSFFSYFEAILVSYRKYNYLAIWNPLPNISRLATLVYFVVFQKDQLTYESILAIYSLSPLFSFTTFFIFSNAMGLLWREKGSFPKENYKTLIQFNIWAFSASLFAIVSDRLEIFLLKKFHSPVVVAEYGTSLQLFSGFVIILATLSSLVLPKLSRLADKPEFKKALLQSILLGASIAIVLSPGWFLGGIILDILFAGKYNNSIHSFQILYPNYLLQLVFAPMGMALFALNQPKLLALLAFLRLVFGLLFDFMFIPEYGSTGAATSQFLGQIVSWLVLLGYFSAIFRTKET